MPRPKVRRHQEPQRLIPAETAEDFLWENRGTLVSAPPRIATAADGTKMDIESGDDVQAYRLDGETIIPGQGTLPLKGRLIRIGVVDAPIEFPNEEERNVVSVSKGTARILKVIGRGKAYGWPIIEE